MKKHSETEKTIVCETIPTRIVGEDFKQMCSKAIRTEIHSVNKCIKEIINYTAEEVESAILDFDIQIDDLLKFMPYFYDLYDDENYDELIGATKMFYLLNDVPMPDFFTTVFESGNTDLVEMFFDAVIDEYELVISNFADDCEEDDD